MKLRGEMRVFSAGMDVIEKKKTLIWQQFIDILEKTRASMLDKKKAQLTVVVTKLEQHVIANYL